VSEHVSLRLPVGTKDRADHLIRYLTHQYPHVPTVTRQSVLRDALLRGLADMEHAARGKDMLGP
jgi:hypothetical protein